MVADALEHPLWAALRGPHRAFARWHGRVGAYLPDVAPFAALGPEPDRRTWDDLAGYAGPGGMVVVAGLPGDPPAGWETLRVVPAVQMVAAPDDSEAGAGLSVLGAADVPEMLDLAERTQPGPFRPRTVELGRYLGVRRDGRLVAMAGERMRPPGHTEISAVCTDPAHRGQGLAARLVRAVAAGIRARGDVPFLHVAEENTAAIRLYESLGFVASRPVVFAGLRAPAGKSRVGPGTRR